MTRSAVARTAATPATSGERPCCQAVALHCGLAWAGSQRIRPGALLCPVRPRCCPHHLTHPCPGPAPRPPPCLAACSGVPPCSPCDYLKTWREEAYLKPPGHDSSLKLALPCGIDAAVVSAGGRLQTWKPENQDVYFMQSLALPGSNGASLAADPWAAGAALGSAAEAGLATPALAVGVFDGHGRLGKHAAQHVRDSMQSSLLRQQRELMSTTQEPCGAGGAGAASPHALMSLALRQGFDTAARSIAASSRDFSKSGCTAVVCGVTPEAVTAVWTGDSRAGGWVVGGPVNACVGGGGGGVAAGVGRVEPSALHAHARAWGLRWLLLHLFCPCLLQGVLS